MTAGIQVFGNHGVLQIDQDYSNLSLSASGSATVGTTTSTMYVDVTITGDTPLMVVKAQDVFIGIYSTVQNGNQFTYRFVSRTIDGYGRTFQWFAFDKVRESGENCGFQVFRADGSIAYDSGCRPLKLTQVIPGGVAGPGSSDPTIAFLIATVPNGNYGFIFSQTTSRFMGSPSGAGFAQVGVARVTSNSVYRTTTSYPAELKATRYEGIASLLLVDLNGIA